jgi:hypothetical protein
MGKNVGSNPRQRRRTRHTFSSLWHPRDFWGLIRSQQRARDWARRRCSIQQLGLLTIMTAHDVDSGLWGRA